jgi:Molecular chaperone GrpE (heat shock protein)
MNFNSKKSKKHNNMDNKNKNKHQSDHAINSDGSDNVSKEEKCEMRDKTEENEVKKEEKKIEVEEKEIENKIQESESKIAEINDKYLRLAAEFDNYRRRSAKDRLDLISTAGESIITGLLPILDDCQRALQVLKDSNDTAAAKEGTELIYNKLFAFLKSKGLAVIDAIGKELDTDFHEAIAHVPVEEKDKKEKIIDVVQDGYTLNGKVIRYAKVVVGK